jgi:hypothetical protein
VDRLCGRGGTQGKRIAQKRAVDNAVFVHSA